MSNEVWKDVEGFEGLYQVSNLGRFKSLGGSPGKSLKDRILKLNLQRDGYLLVWFYKNSKRYGNLIHILVARAFIGPCPEGMEVNHKDADKANNHVDNLEYITHLENVRHAWANGRGNPSRGEKCVTSKLTEIDVLNIRKLHNSGFSIRGLARKFKVAQKTIQNVVRRNTWKHI